VVELKRILLTTDLSEYAGHATNYACDLADRFEAELHVLYVFTQFVPSGDWSYPQWNELMQKIQKEEADALTKVIPAEWRTTHTVVHATAQGSAAAEIIRYAKDHAIDLIVLATHGRTGLSHMLIGSTAERVVRMAPCPVLTVRPKGHQFVMP
jgi:nucleotide-binding universal stress UspA family protein